MSELGHWYVLRFDGGHELETVLPAPDLVQFDPPTDPVPPDIPARLDRMSPRAGQQARRYASIRIGGLLRVWRRSRQQPGTCPLRTTA